MTGQVIYCNQPGQAWSYKTGQDNVVLFNQSSQSVV